MAFRQDMRVTAGATKSVHIAMTAGEATEDIAVRGEKPIDPTDLATAIVRQTAVATQLKAAVSAEPAADGSTADLGDDIDALFEDYALPDDDGPNDRAP